MVVDKAVDVLNRDDGGGGGIRVRSEGEGEDEDKADSEDRVSTRDWDCEVMMDGCVNDVGLFFI